MSEVMKVQTFIDNEIAEKQVVIWSLVKCPHCRATKKLLAEIQEGRQGSSLKVAIHNVDEMENGGAIKTNLFRMTSQRLYPNIYINGKQIGGNDTFQRLHTIGELSKLLDKTYPSKWAIKS
jgi:glutaredoxin 3